MALSAVVWEARYKLVDPLLRARPVAQVLELAAGFSRRGRPSLATRAPGALRRCVDQARR